MEWRGWGRGGERPPARKLAFSSSPSAGGREILIGSLTVNVNQNLSAESFSHDGRLAMLWKNVYLCIFRFCEMQMEEYPEGRTETGGERNAV